jgi:hypothetical protein
MRPVVILYMIIRDKQLFILAIRWQKLGQGNFAIGICFQPAEVRDGLFVQTRGGLIDLSPAKS